MATVEERFWAKVACIPFHGCWEWTGAIRENGYGAFSVGRKAVQAHRASYELLIGPIPSGLVIDHKCRNRACVRPEHLEPVTQRTNVLRGRLGQRLPYCLRGHASTEDNTYRSKGRPQCRACAIQRATDRYARQKEGR